MEARIKMKNPFVFADWETPSLFISEGDETINFYFENKEDMNKFISDVFSTKEKLFKKVIGE